MTLRVHENDGARGPRQRQAGGGGAQRACGSLPAAALMLLLLAPLQSKGWGAWAHEHINRGAVLALPAPLRVFFYNHIEFMTEESVMPDVRKHLLDDQAEYPRHSIFLENYGPDALHTLPRGWTEAARQLPPEVRRKNGTLPWTIEEFTDKLTDAFRRRDKEAILFLAATLGHYLGDANMPLHTTKNNNGQFSNQTDLHPLFEGQLVEMFGDTYRLNPGPAQTIQDLTAATWAMIAATSAQAPILLAVDRRLRQEYPDAARYLLDSNGRLLRNRTLALYFSRAYATRLHQELHGMVEQDIRSSIASTAAFWNTAWQTAGRPELISLDAPATTQRHAAALAEEERLWQTGHTVPLQPTPEFDLSRLQR